MKVEDVLYLEFEILKPLPKPRLKKQKTKTKRKNIQN